MVERYGVPPELVPDFIALRGDPSDGLPGAPGIGAKTAAELLRRYGPLEQVLDAAEQAATRVRREQVDMRPRTAASLRENDELLRRFKQIATLQHVDLPSPPSTPHRLRSAARRSRARWGCAGFPSGCARSPRGEGAPPGYGVNLTVITSPSATA